MVISISSKPKKINDEFGNGRKAKKSLKERCEKGTKKSELIASCSGRPSFVIVRTPQAGQPVRHGG
jgi:hypothetical protein